MQYHNIESEFGAGLGQWWGRRGLSQGPDSGDKVQTKEEGGKIWGQETKGRDLGQEATGGIRKGQQVPESEWQGKIRYSGRIQAGKVEHTKIILIQAGECSQLKPFFKKNRVPFINS